MHLINFDVIFNQVFIWKLCTHCTKKSFAGRTLLISLAIFFCGNFIFFFLNLSHTYILHSPIKTGVFVFSFLMCHLRNIHQNLFTFNNCDYIDKRILATVTSLWITRSTFNIPKRPLIISISCDTQHHFHNRNSFTNPIANTQNLTSLFQCWFFSQQFVVIGYNFFIFCAISI